MEEKLSKSTVRMAMKMLALLGILFVFLPSFVVSCAGEKVNVNVMTAVKGVEANGTVISEPNLIMLLCLIIPIAVIVLLTVQKFNESQTSIIILASMAVDFIIWLVFRSKVKELAESSYCEFKTTIWFFLNMLGMLLMIALAVLVMLRKLALDTPLKDVLKNLNVDGIVKIQKKDSEAMDMNQAQPEDSAASNEEQLRFCTECGAKLSSEARFCVKCGAKVE